MDITSPLLQHNLLALELPSSGDDCVEPPNKRSACEPVTPIKPTSVPTSQTTSILNGSVECSSLNDMRNRLRSKFMAVLGPVLDDHLQNVLVCAKTVRELREETKTLRATTLSLEEIIRSIKPSVGLRPVSIVRPCQLSPPNPVFSSKGVDPVQHNGTVTAPSGRPLNISRSAPALAALDAGKVLRPLSRNYPLPAVPLPAWSPPDTPLDAEGRPLALDVQPALHLITSPTTEGVCLRWEIDGSNGKFEPAVTYELFNYTSSDLKGRSASTDVWKKISDIGALPLPMTCTLSSLFSNVVYYFAMRSVDRFSRFSDWSNVVNAFIR
ncbi:hypothetical protein AAHC03_020956 [Spirometra sp. Aus1]